MVVNLNFKTLCPLALLCLVSVHASAQLNAVNTNINSINSDRAVVTASFSAPVTGDLYIAVDVGGGNYLFFGNQGTQLSTSAVPYLAGGSFSQDLVVIDIPASNIPQGTYTVYQVVARSGSDIFKGDWLSELSSLTLSVNMNNNPIPLDGAALFKSLTCNSAACHGPDPSKNKNNILSNYSAKII